MTPNVYFQPPENVALTYPCIIYQLDDIAPRFADNNPYRLEKAYEVQVLDRDPDSVIRDAVSKLPRCRFVRAYFVSGINHYIFTVFF